MVFETSTQTIFYYPVTSIIDRLKMYSQYPARTATTEGDVRELILTDDETTLIHAEAKTAIAKIFQKAAKLSGKAAGSLMQNALLDTHPPNPAIAVYGFKLVNNLAYDPNIVTMADSCIEEYFTSLILASWFMITKQNELAKNELAKHPSLQTAYNNSLTQLYKPIIA